MPALPHPLDAAPAADHEEPAPLVEAMPAPPAGVLEAAASGGWRSTMLRACLVGLAAGAVAIGLIENVTRFGDPEGVAADTRADAPPLPLVPAEAPEAAPGPRGDRLDLSALTPPDGAAVAGVVALR